VAYGSQREDEARVTGVAGAVLAKRFRGESWLGGCKISEERRTGPKEEEEAPGLLVAELGESR
jgi:hypothetical protein